MYVFQQTASTTAFERKHVGELRVPATAHPLSSAAATAAKDKDKGKGNDAGPATPRSHRSSAALGGAYTRSSHPTGAPGTDYTY